MSTHDQPAQPELHKGLEGVLAGETSISDVDGHRCQLIYRGYHIDELAGRATYEEVSYLLLNGTLPARGQLADWTAQLAAARPLEPAVLSLLQALPRQANPIALLRTAISILGLFEPDTDSDSPESLRGKAVRTIAKIPTVVAAIGRLRALQPPLAPRPQLGQAANFLYMLLGKEPTA